MSKTVVILLVVGFGVGLILLLKNMGGNQRPAVSGQTNAGPAPAGVGRTGSKVTNTVNDVLSFAKQGVDIYGAWNTAQKSYS